MFGDIILGSTLARHLKERDSNETITYISSCKAITVHNPYIDYSIQINLHKKLDYIVFRLIKLFFKKTIFLKHWLPEDNIFKSYLKSGGVEVIRFNPTIFLTKQDINLAQTILANEIKNSPKKPTIAIQSDFDRKWNITEFLKLKESLQKKYNLIEIGFGLSYEGKVLNFRESAALISLCDLFVGGISGNLHAAVAVSTPSISTPNVFDPRWDMPEHYSIDGTYHKTVLPLKKNFCGNYACVSVGNDHVQVKNGDYSPKHCPEGLPQSCIHSISAKQIEIEVDKFFKIYPITQ